MSRGSAFSLGERDRRWDLARTFMEGEGLDALLVFGEHEDAGPAPFAYDTWFTKGRAGTTVVFPRLGEPISHFPMEMFAKDYLESTGAATSSGGALRRSAPRGTRGRSPRRSTIWG